MQTDEKTQDARLDAKIGARRHDNGHRELTCNGEALPFYTTTDPVTFTAVRGGAWRDSGSFWPASPDDVWVAGSGEVIYYEVTMKAFVDAKTVEVDPVLIEAGSVVMAERPFTTEPPTLMADDD